MHEVLLNRSVKLAQEKVWLGELTMTIAFDRDVKDKTKKTMLRSESPVSEIKHDTVNILKF